jgi:rhodanese-related sulfurtransferase
MSTQDALRMSPQELHDRLDRGEPVIILDVRTGDARKIHPSQIPGARWLPLASVVERAKDLPWWGTIVCYCT